MATKQRKTMWVWAYIARPLIKSTEYSFGFGEDVNDVELWIPRACLREFEYELGGDACDVRLGATVRSILIPDWLAASRELGICK